MSGFEDLVAVTMNGIMFGDVTPYNLVGIYRHFKIMSVNFCQIPRRHIQQDVILNGSSLMMMIIIMLSKFYPKRIVKRRRNHTGNRMKLYTYVMHNHTAYLYFGIRKICFLARCSCPVERFCDISAESRNILIIKTSVTRSWYNKKWRNSRIRHYKRLNQCKFCWKQCSLRVLSDSDIMQQ